MTALGPFGPPDSVRSGLAYWGKAVSTAYWIVCPKAASNAPKIVTFRKWPLAEAAEDARRLRGTDRVKAL
jgi:hypothetical protein